MLKRESDLSIYVAWCTDDMTDVLVAGGRLTGGGGGEKTDFGVFVEETDGWRIDVFSALLGPVIGRHGGSV